MDLGSIFVIAAIAFLAAIFIGQPFLNGKEKDELVPASKTVADQDHERSALLAERDRLLTALQELDFDNALGKIPEEDYPVQRAVLLKSGADVLRRLDELEPAAGQSETSAEARMEAAIAARRADGVARDMDDIETAIVNRRLNREGKSAGFCPKCGSPLQSSDVFCSKCGLPVGKES
jgi:hypothetical protein